MWVPFDAIWWGLALLMGGAVAYAAALWVVWRERRANRGLRRDVRALADTVTALTHTLDTLAKNVTDVNNDLADVNARTTAQQVLAQKHEARIGAMEAAFRSQAAELAQQTRLLERMTPIVEALNGRDLARQMWAEMEALNRRSGQPIPLPNIHVTGAQAAGGDQFHAGDLSGRGAALGRAAQAEVKEE